jgi:hypothetical protein
MAYEANETEPNETKCSLEAAESFEDGQHCRMADSHVGVNLTHV